MPMKETESSVLIRPAELGDARDINVLRRTPDLARNLVALPSETIVQNEDFISAQLRSPDDHLFCAEIAQRSGFIFPTLLLLLPIIFAKHM